MEQAAETIRAAVVLDLLHDFFGVFGAVKANEYFVNHRLLVGREKLGELVVSDVPVVVHLERSGWSNGKQTAFFCFSLKLLKSVVTSVSEVARLWPELPSRRPAKPTRSAAAAAARLVAVEEARRGPLRQSGPLQKRS